MGSYMYVLTFNYNSVAIDFKPYTIDGDPLYPVICTQLWNFKEIVMKTVTLLTITQLQSMSFVYRTYL